MGTWPKIVQSFPLTVSGVFERYTLMPSEASDVLYHYTTPVGLEGILRSGGLRATYRIRMNDAGEFDYAKRMIYEALDELGRRRDLPTVAQSLATFSRKNLDKILDNTSEMSRAYCACLTISPDHPKQWETYAEDGMGFAIGFDLSLLLKMQASAVPKGGPFIFCAPVTYNQHDQCDLVWRLVEAGIWDLQTFATTRSGQSEHLTALRDRITREIVVHLFTLIDFVKAPSYSSEREVRLILDPNDGTLKVSHIEYYKRNNESVPFIFMNLRNPKTSRLPLAEIKIGPRALFSEAKTFLEDLLDELGYGSNYEDRPRIIQSALRITN